MAKLKDVAKCANVSIATVSKVVNNVDSYMSDETRRRVEAAIEECGYIPNMVARGLKIRKTNTLGFILPDITNPFYAEIAKGIEMIARERGYSLVICDTSVSLEAELQSIEILKTKMVDGIILGSRMFYYDEMDEDTFGKIPVVIIGRILGEPKLRKWGQVSIDEKRMISESVYRLKEAGCRQIALITANETGEHAKNFRLTGFLDAMKTEGLELHSERVFLGEYDLSTGYEGMRVLFQKQIPVDGIVCGNDLIAIGVLKAARELHIPIPEKLKVIGFDNIPISEYTNPSLSTISQPAYHIGEIASEMLIDHIEKNAELRVHFLEHTYIERETV